MTSFLLPLGLFLFVASYSYEFDLEDYLSKSSHQSNKVFLSQFPFGEYLRKTEISNFQIIESHRVLLNRTGRDGNSFLINLFTRYIEASSLHEDAIKEMENILTVAEQALSFQLVNDQSPNETYKIVGYTLLDTVASTLENSLKQKRLNKNAKAVKHLVSRLEEHQYGIDIPVSRFKKLLLYSKKGEWRYIWKRIKNGYLLLFFGLLGTTSFVIFLIGSTIYKKYKIGRLQHSYSQSVDHD